MIDRRDDDHVVSTPKKVCYSIIYLLRHEIWKKIQN
jgi:hypothetical protein